MDKKKCEKTNYPNIYKNKENKTYAIDLSLGYDNITGKRIRTTRTGIKTEKEAKELLKKITMDDKLKKDLINKLTFDQAYEKFLYYYEHEKKAAVNTIKKRRLFYKNYFKPFFKNVKLEKIKKKDGLDFQKYLMQRDTISDRTRHDIFTILITFFKWCVKNDYISASPLYGIDNFSFKEKKMEFYTPEEFDKLVIELDKEYDKTKQISIMASALFCRLMFFLGTRAGETQAFQLKDIDFTNKSISINKSAHFEVGKGTVIGFTKTSSSNRTLYTSDALLSYIQAYINEIEQIFNIKLSDENYLFFNYYDNRLYNIESLRHLIQHAMDRADLKRIRLHDFRHSHTALLMSQGEELYYIQQELGHKKYDTTVNIYGHLDEKKKRSVAEKIEKFIV